MFVSIEMQCCNVKAESSQQHYKLEQRQQHISRHPFWSALRKFASLYGDAWRQLLLSAQQPSPPRMQAQRAQANVLHAATAFGRTSCTNLSIARSQLACSCPLYCVGQNMQCLAAISQAVSRAMRFFGVNFNLCLKSIHMHL